MDPTTPKRQLEFEQDEDHANIYIDKESCVLIYNKLPETMVSKVGMEFGTEDEAYEFYNAYAREAGFLKSKVHKDNGKLWIETLYVHVRAIEVEIMSTSRIDRRQFNSEHNHNLASLSKSHLYRLHRNMLDSQALDVDMVENSGIAPKYIFEYITKQAGGHDKFGFSHVDLENYFQAKRNLQMKSGEIGEDLNFFYAIQVDEDDLITNIFWEDAKMMANYDDFRDVFYFDTIYRKHKDGPLIALFVGMNHHKQTAIFGVALLFDETSVSFVWLFDTFTRAKGENC
ncbi:LOW QUALITY PROTEIN: hypothetical protein V2J09_018217 [Rumex salicifolius]